MSADKATLDFYDQESASYAEWSAPKEEYPWLEKFISMVPEDALLLDFGCGSGWAAKRMLDAGRKVEAFDGSPGLAAEARKLTGLDVKVMRFEELAEVERYDGLWASFCLLHAPRSAMQGNLARISRALRPGGLFYLGLKRGNEESRDSHGRFYSFFEPEELTTWLMEAGFGEIDIREKTGSGYDGGKSYPVMHIFCRKGAAHG